MLIRHRAVRSGTANGLASAAPGRVHRGKGIVRRAPFGRCSVDLCRRTGLAGDRARRADARQLVKAPAAYTACAHAPDMRTEEPFAMYPDVPVTPMQWAFEWGSTPVNGSSSKRNGVQPTGGEEMLQWFVTFVACPPVRA